MAEKWNPQEVLTLHEQYGKRSRKEISTALSGRAWSAIQQKAESLGIHRTALRAPWTIEQIEQLKVRYPTGERMEELARQLEHSPTAIKTVASRLGLVRDRRQVPITKDRRSDEAPLLAHLTEAERGYIAGFLDGEGSIFVSRTRRESPIGFAWTVAVTATNTDPRPIEWLLHNVPGSRLYIGKAAPNRLIPYTWRLFSGAAVRMCREIAPYLMIKRAEAELVAEQLSAGFAPLSVPQRDVLWRQLHTLKTKGKNQGISTT